MNTTVSRTLQYCLLLLFVALGAPTASGQDSHEWAHGTWTTLESEDGPMGRHEHGYIRVGARFYLFGGRGERPVQAFDPVGETWTTLGTPPLELHHFQPVEYHGKIYIMGAFTGPWPTETPVPNIYIYDPAGDTWTEGPSIPADRRRGAAGLVTYADELYLVSGIQNGHTDGHVPWLDRYSPHSDTWTQLPDAPRARDHFQAVVIGNTLYVAGGRRSSYGTGQPVELTVPEVDVFDLLSGRWETLPDSSNIPTPRAGTTALRYHSKLVVIGGESQWGLSVNPGNPPAHTEVEAFDPSTGAWMSMPSLNEGLHAMQAILYGGRIYIASGSKTVGATEVSRQIVYSPGQ